MTQGTLTAEYVAKLAAASSAGIAGVTWLATLNDVLQLVATVIGIVAGIYAIVWHRVRIEKERSKIVTREVAPTEPEKEDIHR